MKAKRQLLNLQNGNRVSRLILLAVAVTLSVTLAGCSSSDNKSGTTTTTTSAEDTTTSTSDDSSTDEPTQNDTGEGTPAPNDPGTNPAPPSATDQTPPAGDLTMEQAVQIAIGKYGGTVVEVEADSHRGTPTWEVELTGTSLGRIEVHVSRATGEILKVDDENDDD